MNIILNDTDLRWYLEDMGDEHKALKQYVLAKLLFYEELRKLAEDTVIKLAAAAHICADIDETKLPAEMQDDFIEVGNTVYDVGTDWKYVLEDM